jgi:hypothetical protein
VVDAAVEDVDRLRCLVLDELADHPRADRAGADDVDAHGQRMSGPESSRQPP